MRNIPDVKIGIVAVSRDCFPISLSERRRAAVVEAYRRAGGEIVEIHTTVENETDGERALLTSPDGAFAPMELHYGETCILPQAAGDYRIEAPDSAPVKVIAACVRG